MRSIGLAALVMVATAVASVPVAAQGVAVKRNAMVMFGSASQHQQSGDHRHQEGREGGRRSTTSSGPTVFGRARHATRSCW